MKNLPEISNAAENILTAALFLKAISDFQYS